MQYRSSSILSILCIIFLLFSYDAVDAHGFSADTLVQLGNGSWQTIHTICLRSLHNKISVSSYNLDTSCKTNQLVKSGRRSQSNCYMRLGFDPGFNDSTPNDIVCTPMQEFYMPETHKWIHAYTLKVGDILLTKDKGVKSVTYIQFVQKPYQIYSLEIKKSHTFFVGKHSILTHNMALPLAFNVGLSIPFGSAAGGTAGSFFGPIGIIGGFVIGGIIGLTMKAMYEDRIPTYNVPEYDIASIKTFRDIVHYSENNNYVNCYAIQSLNEATYEPSLNVTIEVGQSGNNLQIQSPKKPSDDEKDKKCNVRICEKSAQHIFRNKRGHLPDTPANRELLIEMVSNKENFLGVDKFGNEWYAKILPDGKQVWAWVRNNIIRNGGLNESPKPFNNQTGLCRIGKS